MSICVIIPKVIVGIECKNEAVEWLDLWCSKCTPEPSSEQIVLFVKNASLAVDVWNSLFKNVFVWLRDIGYQEITKDDEKESDQEDPHNPNDHSHSSGKLYISSLRSFKLTKWIRFLFVDNIHPIWIAWWSSLSYSVPEGVNVILDDWIVLSNKLSTGKEILWTFSHSSWITSSFQTIAKGDNIKTGGLKNSRHEHDGNEEEEQELVNLIHCSINQINHCSKCMLVHQEIQGLFCKHN